MKEIGINIYGISGDSNTECRYIQCGYTNENDEFTGIVVDYEGGGCSGETYFVNGEEVDWNEDTDEVDTFFEKCAKANEILSFFNKYFVMDKENPGFYFLRNPLEDNFGLRDLTNVYYLRNGADFEPVNCSRGLSIFSVSKDMGKVAVAAVMNHF